MTEMTHPDALKELAVERYLLDELTGEARERFEAHLFDCTLCAADLKQGLLFLEAAKQELRAEVPAAAPRPVRTWWSSLLQPWVLAPALAACLAVIFYQSAVLLPHAQSQLAQMQSPSVVNTLVLANAGARGDSPQAEISAPPGGVYLLSVDLPPSPGASAYRCTLYDSTGKPVWHTDIPAVQDRDSVKIQVPVTATGPGANTLLVQAVGPGETLKNLASYRYNLRLTAY